AENKRNYARSSIVKKSNNITENDPWKLKPIDFSIKNFHPKPHRKHELAQQLQQQHQTLIDKDGRKSRDDSIVMKYFSRDSMQLSNTEKNNEFITNRNIEYEPIENITNIGKFKDLKLHDYRGYPKIEELGLPEFETNYDRDPFKIKFLSSNLQTLWRHQSDKQLRNDENSYIQMSRVMTARPQWDAKLILPQLCFPTPYAAYTRYRKPNRTLQSAYWGRVEENLSKQKPNKQQPDFSKINMSNSIHVE
ncbi:unnamed protein product, partial [Didymodactylos carnosus]